MRFIFLSILCLILASCSGGRSVDERLVSPEEIEDTVIEIVAPEVVEPVVVVPEPPQFTGTQDELKTKIGDRVFFETNSSQLGTIAQKILQRQAQWLMANPDVSLIIEGHCDERGTREYNLALGAKRAAATKRYLMSVGVAPNRLTTISYGKEKPEYLGSAALTWAKNRRGVSRVR